MIKVRESGAEFPDDRSTDLEREKRVAHMMLQHLKLDLPPGMQHIDFSKN